MSPDRYATFAGVLTGFLERVEDYGLVAPWAKQWCPSSSTGARHFGTESGHSKTCHACARNGDERRVGVDAKEVRISDLAAKNDADF
jgi:hypothetical protein